MGSGKLKRARNKIKEAAQEVAHDEAQKVHLQTIQNYIDGIIELPYWKRRKVLRAIMKKRNPFGNSPAKKEVKNGKDA